MEKMDFLPPSAPNLVFERETYMAYWSMNPVNNYDGKQFQINMFWSFLRKVATL